VAEVLAHPLPAKPRFIDADITRGLDAAAPADLVTLCYVLDELPPAAAAPLLRTLWSLTAGHLVIVEPGTPSGWQRILAARSLLLEAGARIAAPCPHPHPCPLLAPDWCHFARRVARSRMHRQTKGGEVPWEDEKYILLAASRRAVPSYAARVLAPPRVASGRVSLKLCKGDGTAEDAVISRRAGEPFRKARRAEWGDGLPE
jgi:ribosomal protein RSM22 (predicted rRNA methylase)